MRRSYLLVVVAVVACDRHKTECEALEKIDASAPNAPAQIDAIGVRDPKLAPLATRYRAALVAEKAKRDDTFAAARDLLPGVSTTDAGTAPSLDHLFADARPLLDCLFERSAECDDVLRAVDACSRPAPGVSVSAHLGVCADAWDAAELTPARETAAHAIAASIRAFAPRTATMTIDAAEAMRRLTRAVPTVRAWQSAIDDSRARAEDIRKACTRR